MATLEVTELPVRKWTQDYKEFLETLIKPESKVSQQVVLSARARIYILMLEPIGLIVAGCSAQLAGSSGSLLPMLQTQVICTGPTTTDSQPSSTPRANRHTES